MKKLAAVLLAAAMTASATGVTAFAVDTDRDVMLSEFDREYFNAIPVYALGRDISAYTPGDVNMDGVIDAKDANLVMVEYCAYTIIELGHFLDEEQRQLADVDSIAESKDPATRITIGDSVLLARYFNYKQIGGEMDAAAYYTVWNTGDRRSLA